jgi:phosphohistidine phosphatase SixA
MGKFGVLRAVGVASLLLLAACESAGPERSAATPLLRDQAAIEALKAGGYVVYLRHGETDSGRDSDFDRLDNCVTQRNLSPRGEEQSRQMGATIRRLAIPVTSVAASPFCRTRKTAELAFGSAPLEAALTSYTDMPPTQRDATNGFVRKQFATAVPAGTNLFLVGHSPPFDAATQHLQPPQFKDKVFLKEGDAAVIRADGQGGYALVGHITVKSWSQMP